MGVFVVRTVPSLANAMQPLEDVIRQKLLPALLGRQVSDELFSLPARFAGLGIANPCTQCEKQFKGFEELTAPLIALILAQAQKLDAKKMHEAQNSIRKSQKNQAEAAFDAQLRKYSGQGSS